MVWQAGTSAGLVAALLLSLAVALIVAGWLPQAPGEGTAAYAKWRSQVQAQFGPATGAMQALGLFSVVQSPGFRLLLSLLAGCLVLRLAELVSAAWRGRRPLQPAVAWRPLPGLSLEEAKERLRAHHYRIAGQPLLLQADRWPWADTWPLLVHLGAVGLMAGMLMAHVFGWHLEGLVVRSGETLALPGTDAWVTLAEGTGRLTHSDGIVAYVEQRGPTVLARAVDSAGSLLALQQSAESEPANELVLDLVEDQFFAVPEAGLVVRLVAQPHRPEIDIMPVVVQVYETPSGRLIGESQLADQAGPTFGEATLLFSQTSYGLVSATSNPGRWLAIPGTCLLTAGALGTALDPRRRLWLREVAGELQTAGRSSPELGEGV
jgi:hypothetical protein